MITDKVMTINSSSTTTSPMFRGKVGFQVDLNLLLLFTNPPFTYSSFFSPSLRQIDRHKLFFLFVLSKPTPLHKFFSSGEQLSNLVVSRKRKAWEGLHAGGSKGGPGRREEEQQEEGEEEKEEKEEKKQEEKEEGRRKGKTKRSRRRRIRRGILVAPLRFNICRRENHQHKTLCLL